MTAKNQVISFLCFLLSWNLQAGEITGLWQFESGAAAYIYIKDNGEVTQCRVPRDGEYIVATGRIDENNSITWSPIIENKGNSAPEKIVGFSWGTDVLTSGSEAIFLEGPHGKFRYTRIVNQLMKECEEIDS